MGYWTLSKPSQIETCSEIGSGARTSKCVAPSTMSKLGIDEFDVVSATEMFLVF